MILNLTYFTSCEKRVHLAMAICWLQKESLPTWYVYVWEPR
ncbi:hypothetical protein IFVP203_C2190231 [Vibrio parahaemolyticus]